MKISRIFSVQRILVSVLCITTVALGVLFFRSHHMSQTGTLLLLNGTSSSGKSAILNSFQKKHPDFKVFKIDDWFPDEMSQRATELGWQESSGMNSWIFLATYAEEKTGKPCFDSEIRAALFPQLAIPMYAAAKKALQAGHNVVIDTVFEYDPLYEKFSGFFAGFKCVKVLVYCPLDVLLERVEARNRSGVQGETRTAFQSFEQFPALYKAQETVDEVIVDTVSAASMKDALRVAVQELIDNKIPDKYLPRLQAFEQDFIEQFKLDGQNSITLVPRHQYDLILNSGKHTPDELAVEIERILN